MYVLAYWPVDVPDMSSINVISNWGNQILKVLNRTYFLAYFLMKDVFLNKKSS